MTTIFTGRVELKRVMGLKHETRKGALRSALEIKSPLLLEATDYMVYWFSRSWMQDWMVIGGNDLK